MDDDATHGVAASSADRRALRIVELGELGESVAERLNEIADHFGIEASDYVTYLVVDDVIRSHRAPALVSPSDPDVAMLVRRGLRLRAHCHQWRRYAEANDFTKAGRAQSAVYQHADQLCRAAGANHQAAMELKFACGRFIVDGDESALDKALRAAVGVG